MLIKLDKQWLRVAVLYWKERWEVMGEGIWQLKGRSSFFGTKNLSLEQESCLNSAGPKAPLPFCFYTFRQCLRGFAKRISTRAHGVHYLSEVSSETTTSLCHKVTPSWEQQHPLVALVCLARASPVVADPGWALHCPIWCQGSCLLPWTEQLQEKGSKSGNMSPRNSCDTARYYPEYNAMVLIILKNCSSSVQKRFENQSTKMEIFGEDLFCCCTHTVHLYWVGMKGKSHAALIRHNLNY